MDQDAILYVIRKAEREKDASNDCETVIKNELQQHEVKRGVAR